MSQARMRRTDGSNSVPRHPPLNVTVLRGGPGSEREVSLVSGHRVAAALRLLGHNVFESDIMPDDIGALDHPADVVFIAMHGEFGEDGQVQRLLEERGLPYCGSAPEACALTMDKVKTKSACIAAGILTPRFDVIRNSRINQACSHWKAPVVVKPIAGGSSVDCEIIHHSSQILPAVERLVGKYGECMIEQFVDGMELTVGILDGLALPPIWIRPAGEFYDYQSKYQDDRTEYHFDIPLPSEFLDNLCDMSLRAFQAAGCRDFARVDWLVERTTNRPYFLEINTIPGLTDHSLLPKAAAQAGIGFGEFCQRLLVMALARSAARERAAG